MSKWPMVKLGDICKITSGGTPNRQNSANFGGSIPWVKTGDLKQRYITIAEEFISEEGLKNSSAKMFPVHTVLVALYGATIGACSILSIDATTNQACGAILPSPEITPEYLYYFLLSHKQTFISQGVGGAQPNISGSIIKETIIPLPPIPEQQRIVEQLDQAQKLIDNRKEQLKLMDDLIQSTFYDMFGDPVKNVKGWEIKAFGEMLYNIDSGTSPVCLAVPASKGYWGVLKLSAVTGGIYLPQSNKQLPANEVPKLSDEVHNFDLLFSRKNTKELVGSCAYVFNTPERLLLPDLIFRLVTKSDVQKLFIWGLFNNSEFKGQIQSLAGGSAASMINISKAKLKELEIPVPPLDLQTAFADRVQQIESLKSQMSASLTDLEQNFNALMQQSFGG